MGEAVEHLANARRAYETAQAAYDEIAAKAQRQRAPVADVAMVQTTREPTPSATTRKLKHCGRRSFG